MSSLLRLVQQQKDFLKSISNWDTLLSSYPPNVGVQDLVVNCDNQHWEDEEKGQNWKKKRPVKVSQLFLSETVAFTIVVFELICKEKDNYYCLLSQMDRILHIVRKNNDRLWMSCCQKIGAVIIIL